MPRKMSSRSANRSTARRRSMMNRMRVKKGPMVKKMVRRGRVS